MNEVNLKFVCVYHLQADVFVFSVSVHSDLPHQIPRNLLRNREK